MASLGSMASLGRNKAAIDSQWIESERRSDFSSSAEKTTADLENAQENTSSDTQSLTPEHREYLIQRHGTVDLDPLPDPNDKDPLNWPAWKKHTNLALVAFHAMMSTFSAASIQCAFQLIAMDLDVSEQRATYLTSLVICIIGVVPLLWIPLADRWGRRPVFLLSLFCSCIANIGCRFSYSYATMALCRAIMAFFICPASAVGSATVVETYFRSDRPRYLGIWTLMVTLGVPVAPFIFGFLAQRVSYRWIYVVLAITNAVQFLLYLFLGPETLYLREVKLTPTPTDPKTLKNRLLPRIDTTPLTLTAFIKPLYLGLHACVTIPAVSYSMIFLWQILINVEMPSIFIRSFNLNTQEVGLQYLAVIAGALIGEFGGRFATDQFISKPRAQGKEQPAPERRLLLSHFGYALTICGLTVFLVQTMNAGDSWNITPLVGIAISAVGNQLVTTLLIPYAVDCFREQAGDVGVYITFVRQVWGFAGPFWFQPLLSEIGFGGLSGFIAGFVVFFCVLPTILLQYKGKEWRAKLPHA
ncbi:hypothetical protein M409DRAFT_20904 [Zasmidium cellare ATCC 36951]|uniref:Major facilitator superfamily (MFS) profile domain-containing protein n=1 Tax=Zasmidium cellare ATCC 36951 TaxID=1080233 RepID=A0A6A6CRW8_ZASCE|nr:uncharacterized protein M409DRAFT_20904 [Zasmidium cellare ATCC 36951]KAF2168890.1 hypothetical protein M409DRAFT_20904 [Zasmidium cellare ATCC 36951]